MGWVTYKYVQTDLLLVYPSDIHVTRNDMYLTSNRTKTGQLSLQDQKSL